ncbi:MAG: rhodanese-like domain-containing protein [Desulfosudaceae bacterium]
MNKRLRYLLLPLLCALAAVSAVAGEDAALFVGPEYAAARTRASSAYVLVDVRPAAEFAAVRIPGSLNIPLYAVATRTFLRGKTVILVNRGFCKSELIRSCRQLKTKGFSPRVLNGGLNAWIAAGLPVRGPSALRPEVDKVSPQEAYLETAGRSFLPVDVSTAARKEIFSHTRFIDPDQKTSLNDLKAYEKEHPLQAVLLFNREGTGYGQLRKQAAAAGMNRLFFLKGGRRAYQQYLDNLERASAPRSKRMKVVNRIPCRSCND